MKQTDLEELNSQLSKAMKHKDSIKPESYYHDVNVTVKHKHYFLGFIRTSSTYSTKVERKFNQEKYNKDIGAANWEINSIKSQINAIHQKELERQQEELKRQQLAKQKEIARKEEIDRKQQLVKQKEINLKINETQNQINSVQQQCNSIKSEIVQEEAKLKDLEYKLSVVKAQLANVQSQKQINDLANNSVEALKSAGIEKRTWILSELFGKPENQKIIEIINSLGFNPSELAYLAMGKVDSNLFDFAMLHFADCSNYQVRDKTLLQLAINSGREDFVQRILSKNSDMTGTLLNAISQNDLVTLNRLFSNDVSLLHKKISGYTVLQLAVSLKDPQIDVVKRILELDQNLIKTLSDNKESALKIAVRTTNKEIVKLLSKYADFQVEFSQLRSDDANEEINNVESVIKFLSEEVVGPTEKQNDDEFDRLLIGDYDH